jgi:hypothetical protein
MANEMGAAAFCCIACCVLIGLIALSGIKNVDPTEMAVQNNWVLCHVSQNVVADPGMKLAGPWMSYVRYPKTVQTISFDSRDRDLLDGRTADGLPLVLGVSFQYQLIPEELYRLYMTYESSYKNYENMYKLMGIHILTEMATNYTAYQFFNDKQRIAWEMKDVMNIYFKANLHASVESLQINEDNLPGPFTDMILNAATMKQNISQTQKTLGAKVVQMETEIKVAEAQANVTVQGAVGRSSAILQGGEADATVITSFIGSEMGAYSEIKTSLGLEGDSLLKYIWYDAVGGGSVVQPGADFSVFSGVTPGAYITEGSR